jgi:serine phosphatase RsbU (regulator of sigma subunit)
VRAGADAPSTVFLTGDEARDHQSVQMLLGAIAQVSESRDLEALLDYVVDQAVEITGAERGLLVVRQGGELSLRTLRGRSGRPLEEDDRRFSTSVVKKVLDSGEALRTTVNSQAEAMELGESVFDLKLRAVMCSPVATEEESSEAALYVDSRAATREFRQSDLGIFCALTQHIAIALRNSRLHQASLEKVRLEESIQLASTIQEGLMPSIPEELGSLEVHGWYRPAEKTSGDFYDFVRLDDGALTVVVGDVTGHGIGPALITATVQGHLRSYLRFVNDPGKLVTMLNQDMARHLDPGLFVTLFLAVIQPDGSLQAVNAGHTPPIWFHGASGTMDTIPGHGPALGMMEDFEYTSSEAKCLEPGDMLIAFTDGFVEARHHTHNDRMFDESGMRAVISDLAREGTAREITEGIVQNVLEFTDGVYEDDMTIVAVRRLQDVATAADPTAAGASGDGGAGA